MRILKRDDLCIDGAPLTVQKATGKQDVHTDLSDSEPMDNSGKGCDMIVFVYLICTVMSTNLLCCWSVKIRILVNIAEWMDFLD